MTILSSAYCLPRIGIGVFLDKFGVHCPDVARHFIQKLQVLHEVTVFLHVTAIPIPSIPEEDQFTITPLTIPHAYRIVIRHGYSEHVITTDLDGLLYAKLHHFLTTNPSKTASTADSHVASKIELSHLKCAYDSQVIYIVGKEQLKIKPPTVFWKGILRQTALRFFVWIKGLTRAKVAEMDIPVGQLVEVGFAKEL